MKQSAAERPDPTTQRKAAIARGAALEHTGKVRVEPIPDFDLDRTIFKTLEGSAARFVVTTRVGKEAHWDAAAAQAVQAEYEGARAAHPLPAVSAELMQFLVSECDFDVEHADGSFLDHLYFCFEYTVQHYPQQSALVMFLHSILGTGTNTFAMTADKIPALRKLMSPSDWTQVEAFPSVLRLLYAGPLRRELRDNAHRADAIDTISFHRVMDNEPITISGKDLWVALNYQLIHLVDFLPVANWATHQNDTSFILFRDLYDLLEKAGKREAHVDYTPGPTTRKMEGEPQGVGAWLTTLIPVSVSERMAAKSVTRFSERIGHSLDYKIVWAAA
ncbi:hypothetical protein GHT07_03365 [Caenimonas koreensis DSM 17982]|uniref:Uncharacterized protein n=1 Tax=Caenimonas koreensis DSM 17982 TaxID=1121255 RepID=A0A844AZ14_9BURK|nr:hypothetical protein [Caenimonas koreensis]MRD46302.1 hypothetical protein [Caenimonas koreensis DSM 17982]